MRIISDVVLLFYSVRPSSPEDVPTKPNLPPVDGQSEGIVDQIIPRFRWRHFITLISSLLSSGVVMWAIFLMLKQFQDRPVPSWKANINLNMAVAWMASIAKLMLIIPLGECIGQAKWGLFSDHRRKLSDLDLADQAGRDPVGALGWLLRFRGGILVHFGAALVVVSLGFDPAMQHLIRYELVAIPDPTLNASIAHNSDYSPVRGLDRGLLFATPKSVLWGAYSSMLGKPLDVDWSCPTGNCVFPETSSVGICSSCEDITSNIQQTCKTLTPNDSFCRSKDICFTSGQMCRYSHRPTNTVVGGGDAFLDLRADGVNFVDSADGKVAISSSIINMTALFIQPRVTDFPDKGPKVETRFPIAPGHVPANAPPQAKAYTCTLSYCEKRFRSSVRNGMLEESWEIATDSQDHFQIEKPDVTKDITDALYEQKIPLTTAPDSTRISVAALYALSQGFAAALTGNSTVPDMAIPVPGTAISSLHRSLYENLLDNRFPDMIGVMADSITNAIRNAGDRPVMPGSVLSPVLHLRVRWSWAALPVSVWALALFLLLFQTVMARKGHTPWLGTSQVAASFIPLEQVVKDHIDKRDACWRDKSGMRKVAEAIKVRVAPKHNVDGEAKLELTWLNSPAP